MLQLRPVVVVRYFKVHLAHANRYTSHMEGTKTIIDIAFMTQVNQIVRLDSFSNHGVPMRVQTYFQQCSS